MSAADCSCQSIPEHLAEKHIDQRVQAHVCGREPQGRFLGDVESVLCTAGARHVARLGESVRDADKVERCKADEKHPDDDKDLCFSLAAGCFGFALRRSV